MIRGCAAWALFASLVPSVALTGPLPAQAATNTLNLSVVDLDTGLAVTDYEWLLNVDDTGNPFDSTGCSASDAGYPDACDWPSIRQIAGAAPIYASGNQDDFGAGIDIADGDYLISVLADGYKLGGVHITVPMNGPVEVALHPDPLPDATMRIKVFHDISPVNGQIDAPAEQGLPGFTATINDTLGQVSTDVYGNPLCTTYQQDAAGAFVLDADGTPIPTGQTNCLVSDANGDIVVPHLGPLRYDVTVAGPDGENWLETTTLEGSWSWDTWLAEGGTGLDNEFVVAGEPFPWTVFGFVQPMNDLPGGTGGVAGTIVSASVYLPQTGALPYFGDIWSGFSGTKVQGPITNAYVALSDLQNGDTAVYVGPAGADGTFEITGVPDGDYLLTWWDFDLHYILDWIQVTVANGQMVDIGTPFLTGWFTKWDGYVFNDLNSNGKKDDGEPGISGYTVVLRDRDNSEIDRMSIAAVTDETGYYLLEKGYPMTSWMVLEAYSDLYYTTGVTYQAENQPEPTTVLGNGVDVGAFPVLGQPGRLDWGVRPYDPGTNGGIVGTVSYDTTRAELDPQYAGAEPWQPGIPGVTVNLYSPVPCGTNDGVSCSTASGPKFELAADGSLAKGQLLNTTVTETWEQPTDCVARDANGVPLTHGPGATENVLPQDDGSRCLEGPLMGTQFQTGFATLDGNYGFADGCFAPNTFDPISGTCTDESGAVTDAFEALPDGHYLVEVDPGVDALGRPLYKPTREEDINTGDGDSYVPAVPPPSCAGALHTVDVAGVGTDGPDATVNPSFADAGGSPWEGMQRPLCDVKLVNLVDQGSIAPLFMFFTDVPLPGRWKGYIIDDLTVSTDITSLNLGEKAGIPNAPIGIYDYSNRLITTIHSDRNGVYEVLLPSTHTVNCPSPSGVCAAMYYLLGNDPGQPGALNSRYNPQYRTIGATFEVYPGLWIPSDLAPTQIVPGVLAAGSLFGAPPQCALPDASPQLFAVSQPWVQRLNNAASAPVTVQGVNFGTSKGQVTLGGVALPDASVTAWNDTSVTFTIPANNTFAWPDGPQQLGLVTAAGDMLANGITFHVRGNGGGYVPNIREVGPGRAYATIQAAIDDVPNNTVVVVYPGTPVQWNPTGAYYENVILHRGRVKLQGVGPGGVRPDGTQVSGSVIDGRGVAGDTDYADQWRVRMETLTWSGNQAIYEGPVISVVAPSTGGRRFFENFSSSIDGFVITGGDQQGFPNALNAVDPSIHEVAAVQGGGIFVNGYARWLQITNNVIESNGGAYGGAIRLGTPHLTGAYTDAQNDDIRISRNRILANGGTNLAGALAVFNGAERYRIDHNEICGNFSAEYGGGISHYGYSPGGQILDNRILFNRSYDEGGGIMIAGELPSDPATLSPGAGPVGIARNLVQNNLSNDDGGGIRFLMAGNFAYDVHDNMIVNNVSTHEGGGVSLNDAPDVRFYNNTVMKNITTATSVTSLGFPAPAGLSTSSNSALLQATLPAGSLGFSNPLLFNNVFWDNRAGTFTGATVAGIGLPGDPNPVNHWDMGVADGSGFLTPTSSLLQTELGTVPSTTNVVGVDPMVVAEYDSTVSVAPWRGNPRFVDILMVTVTQGPDIGDYHLQTGSPAIGIGTGSSGGVSAATLDFDGDQRPVNTTYDAGADEVVAQ